MTQTGRVILVTGKVCKVENTLGDVFTCTVRGLFRLKNIRTTNPVTVGDIVDFTISDNEELGVICNIHERKNCIMRRSVNLSHESHLIATNIDMAFLVVSMINPTTPLGFIDRFTVATTAFHLPLTLIFNKFDLYSDEILKDLEKMKDLYTKIGFSCLETSALTGYNIDLLRDMTSEKTILFSGNSGVGKSALINALDGSQNLKTGLISDFHKKGRHTTTFSEMHKLSNAAYIIDSPGIKEFGLVNLPKEEIRLYFPEMFAVQKNCKFADCSHRMERDCAVKTAVESGTIAESRYRNYLYMLAD